MHFFYHVKEWGSLHNPEKKMIWDILGFHFISEDENGKKNCYYLYTQTHNITEIYDN